MSIISIDPDSVRSRLTEFLRHEIARAGRHRAVLNLSGGLDSALVCYLAAEALGAHNVLALRLPYKTSSPDSLQHAQQVINALGVSALTFDITPMVEPLIERFPEMCAVRCGNLMARARMIVLYDQSEAFEALPLGTANKSEILLGYTTLYGDSACALNPLGDVYKTQVRQLARAVGVPQAILDKPPSADLWAGQTDEGELGFTYAEVDRLLYLLVERGFTPEACQAQGFSAEFIQAVIQRVRRNRFKRRLPLIASLGEHTVGEGYREL